MPDEVLDELIELITVDAYGDEGYWAFLQQFVDDWTFPVRATLAGMPVQVTGVDFDGNERRGLVAILERADPNHDPAVVSLIDIEGPEADSATRLLLAAYRRWLGIT